MAVDPPRSNGGRAPVAERARVTVQVLRPARISAALQASPEEQANAPAKRIQRHRDAAGTIWIEFS